MEEPQDNIDEVVPTTDSARRVVELVRKYGKNYVAGELSADREMALTGSEIPTFCSENRFEDANTCFFNKIYGKKQVDNEYTQHGRKYEPVAISKFKKQTGAKVFYVTFMRSEKYPFLGGTFDFLAIMPDGEGVLGEVKCPLKRSIGDSVPPQYVGQVQTYLEISNLPICLFVQYKTEYVTPARKWKRPEKMIITTVPYDPNYFKVRMPVLWDFWVKICAWRRAVVPSADLACRLLVAAWRVSKHRITPLRAKLAAVAFRRLRIAHIGMYDAVVEEVNQTKPAICEEAHRPLVIDCKQAEVLTGEISRLVVSVGSAFAPPTTTEPPAMWDLPRDEPTQLVVQVSPSDSMGSMAFAVRSAQSAATKRPMSYPSSQGDKKQKTDE